MSYTPEIADKIVKGIEEGIPLRQICREEGMPGKSTVYEWIEKNEDFAGRIARAREKGFDAIAEECLDIADDASNDWMKRKLSEDVEVETFNSEHVQRSKLRIETRLKLLSKWSPKKYGEKLDIDHTTKGEKINQPDLSKYSDDELRLLAELQRKSGTGAA